MSDSLIQAKAALRDEMRRQLSTVSAEQASAMSLSVCRRVIAHEAFLNSDTIMMYLPLPNEVDVSAVALRCFQTGRTVCVPRVDWERKRMTAIEVRDFETGLQETRNGVREPVSGRPIPLEQIGLVLAPGLAFDSLGSRLGRGGGFYDRFLSGDPSNERLRNQRWFTAGVCFDFQVVDRVPTDELDIRLDAVVTDRRLIEPTPRRSLRAN